MASIPDIRDRVEIVLDNLFSVDSNEIDDQRWLILTEHINKLADQQDIDGIVVTHGTDTMEETSYFLNLTVNTCCFNRCNASCNCNKCRWTI